MKSLWTPKAIDRETHAVQKRASIILKNVCALKGNRTLENTLLPLNHLSREVVGLRNQSSLLAAVHPEKAMRDAGEKSVEVLSAFMSKLATRQDLYHAIEAVPAHTLDEEAQRVREKELRDFRLAGIMLPEKTRTQVQKLSDHMTKLGQKFDANIRDDVRYIEVAPSSLDGLPEDYRHARPLSKKGTVRLSTQYPDLQPFMKYSKDKNARKSFHFLNANRGWPKNGPVLIQLLAARQKQAKLLGFVHWADYITADKMIGTGKNVEEFLSELERLTRTPAQRDYSALLKRKQKDEKGATAVYAWESTYYDNLLAEETIGYRTQEAREYFQFPRVKEAIMALAKSLFGLEFILVKSKMWHKEVETYEVFRNKKLIGRAYLDLHPREGKYGHAACFDIIPGIAGMQLPEAALVCNFPKMLMSHDDVVTFFHEFGHLAHFLLSGKSQWVRLSGFATEWDFVEAPSQMLEAWAIDEKTLRSFAKHEKTGKRMSSLLAQKIKKTEEWNKGLWTRRQLSLAMLSYRFHKEKIATVKDLERIQANVSRQVGTFPRTTGTHGYANFGHLNGYSALYYTYQWSLAISHDLLTRFRKEGFQNKTVARDYVEKIISKGGAEDAEGMIRAFLGRKWNMKAYRAWLKS